MSPLKFDIFIRVFDGLHLALKHSLMLESICLILLLLMKMTHSHFGPKLLQIGHGYGAALFPRYYQLGRILLRLRPLGGGKCLGSDDSAETLIV